jgi:hypothetical protein
MRRGVWGRDDTILVASGPGIRKVSASGSVATDVTSLDGSLEEIGHSSPWFLPDNRHFLFKTSSESGNAGIYVGSLTSTSRSHVITVDSRAVYSEGFILFVRPTRTGIATLLAQRFDTDRLRLTGEATPIADDLLYDEKFQLAGFETSADGTLIYRTAAPSVISIRTGNSIGPANRDSSPIKIIRNWTSLLKP